MPRILLVEDHKSTRELCRNFLRQHGHEVVAADNGRIALAIVQSAYLDAVVTEWRLPDMTGEKFLESLACLNRDPPVIIYSNQPHLCPKAFSSGQVRASIAKTENLTDLLVTLEQVLNGPDLIQSPRHGISSPHEDITESTQC